ncbi:lytic murein transglycosylase B [Neiella marina]|uniref:Lytic murein transglycosylase B n=1 Tax=Neiella holothuriorum TaxID=2870530 RepID=A0ABS7EEG4_9GAMM|nr:lytic murein transglycosylase B [Neiella holothuriorum]MBW8190720.1 lytic murein transglycosylase B [Neiella holothuriorum]
MNFSTIRLPSWARSIGLSVCASLAAFSAHTAASNTIDDAFINEVVSSYQLDERWIRTQVKAAQFNPEIIERITTPWEAKPWYQYQTIFLKPERVEQAVEFWQQHQQVLARAEQQYGVPPQFIAAIIGVETYFGRFKGDKKVLDSLYTLGFHYPKRAKFFRSELGHFLALSYEQGWDPATIYGSYAGAMGFPQFISSSYRAYAVDFNGDGQRDLLNSPEDAIGSVANYFAEHGWQAGTCLVDEVTLTPAAEKFVQTDTKIKHSWGDVRGAGIVTSQHLSDNDKVMLFPLAQDENINRHYLGCNNFYVITRYNHSRLYAMAVYRLSQQIEAAWQAKQVAN